MLHQGDLDTGKGSYLHFHTTISALQQLSMHKRKFVVRVNLHGPFSKGPFRVRDPCAATHFTQPLATGQLPTHADLDVHRTEQVWHICVAPSEKQCLHGTRQRLPFGAQFATKTNSKNSAKLTTVSVQQAQQPSKPCQALLRQAMQ